MGETPMRLTCTHCGTRYQTHLDALPPAGVSAPCRRCGRTLLTHPNGSSRKQARPRAWVLTGDPAIDAHLDPLTIARLRRGYDVLVIGPTGREDIAEAVARGRIPTPEAVLFGTTHVQASDPLLIGLARLPGCERILVANDPQDEARVRRAFTVDRRIGGPADLYAAA